MDLIKQLFTQLKDIWSRWTRSQRTAIVGIAVVSVLGVGALTMWGSQHDYVELASNRPTSEFHEILSTLQAESIDYELNVTGTSVSVPVEDLARARVALKETGNVVDESVEQGSGGFGFGVNPAQQQSLQQRAHERRIAASISKMQAVRSATVHISESKRSPFLTEQQPAKASVVLQLQNGASFSGADAAAIVSLVSHAVENLSPENTTIIDTEGRVLSDGDNVSGDVGGQLDFKRRLESSLSAKAEALLIPLLGHGHAVVQVTADVDFTETNTNRTMVDPDAKAKTKEKIESIKSTGGGGVAGGVGIAANGGSTNGSGSAGGSSEEEKIETDYQNSETVDTIREAPGRLKRLTIGAVIQLPEPETNEDGTPVAAAAPAITQQQIEEIIKQAVGYSEERQDEIKVLAGKMSGMPDFMAPIGWGERIQEFAPLLSSAAMIVASLIALMLGLKTINKLKPVVVEVESRDKIDPEIRAQLADMSEEILQHPEAVSTVLAGWLADQADTENEKRKVA